MSMVIAHSGVETTDVFGISDYFDPFFKRSSQTSLNSDPVSTMVGRIIAWWDDLPVHPFAESEYVFPRQPAQAVEHVAFLLGISNERVLAAVGIKPRTYYGWKTANHRARSQSLGKLWPMTEAIHYMAHAHPNLAAWFNSESQAQALFDAGNIDQLVLLELDWATRNYPRPRPIAPDFGDGSGLATPFNGPESEPEPEQEPGRQKQKRRVGPTTRGVVEVTRRNISSHE
ncbi:hypothetical protein RBS60_03935 [Sinomonas sp. ASV486]|uniref:hypothetical protein n=1 Tax=Sinomonas sp. ASV486 TaxID=3051170 RepID=UPI0027DD85A0|nr:hypothetical protein [Sinomonas sp. ASV486]MDQ4489347.1 hypothetical protein [Sinomonas sp. ASV486]